jgi:hypothetical protein
MNFVLNWNAVIEGAVGGVVAPVVLGLIILARDRCRNLLLRRQVERSVKRPTTGGGIKGITVSVHNRVRRPVTVRAVALVTETCEYMFASTGEVHTSSEETEVKPTKEQLKRLARGEQVLMATVAHLPVSIAVQEGFATVTPFTSHTFILAPELISDVSTNVRFLRVVCEYQDWTNQVRILNLLLKGDLITSLQRTVSELRAQMLNGSLNVARRAFHLPEVPPPAS